MTYLGRLRDYLRSRCTPGAGSAPRPAGGPCRDQSARSKRCREPFHTADAIELRPRPSTPRRLALRPQAARTASSGLEKHTGSDRTRPGTTRTTGGRPRGSMPRSHRPTRHTSALRSPLPPTRGRGLGVEVAQMMPRSSTHPDHAASPPQSLCRLEMAPSIQYSFCTARCDA